MNYFDLYWKSDVPEGKSGNVRIVKFTVSPDEAAFTAMRQDYVASGNYTKLIVGHQLMMSDTRSEYNSCCQLFAVARGTILINGLGLGCCLDVLLNLPRVDEITVIEKNEDVIKLVAPHFTDSRLTIIHDDAYTYKPPKDKRYDVVWHDIWPEKTTDNLPKMTKLHRKYGRRCEWQDSWSRNELKRLQDKIKRGYSSWR